MRKSILAGIFTVLMIGLLALIGNKVSAQNPAPTSVPQVEKRGDAIRSVNPSAPSVITSLPMSNPFCSQPDPAVNQCYLNVRSWEAVDDTTGNILSYVLMSVDGKLRYRSNAFFESYVSYNYDMIPNGIKVTCGLPNAGGFGALYGNAYTIDVKAFDVTNTWVLDDQLQVKCPAFNP